ncbi:5-carboxymethyl-2-hydroxymuconate isomerase [Colwellia sp. MT41]|uniref:5-carboxymethyl-2-hydroxymuconate Delta-isomerase n=1 Tax=Colwellia sp. MT41 TaxID=58049 RepID=UPI000717B6EE|nr:5-carboxymethyl-2-hydroxymuconate Delta-isomerase [Colwellia sp. MT41]ALO34517.1 5-carboxymethyl-2-hydroxymuconate isomerase [Colwellia sp. MT41]
MPHCIIEHSKNIDGKALIPLVFSGALKSELFEMDGKDIKVRALSFTDHQSGDEITSFAHITLKILSGRNTEQKSLLSQSVLEQLKTLKLSSCSLSVEVVDIDRVSYAKVVT